MASREIVTDTQEGFAGGLNLTSDLSALKPDQFREGRNATLTEKGGVKRRLGCRRLHSAALGSGNPIMGGYYWERQAGDLLVAASNSNLYTATYAIPATWTSRSAAISTGSPVAFASFRDGVTSEVLYIADGGLLNKYDGTTFTANIASTPSCNYLAVYNSRLFGVTGTTPSLFYSAIDNGDTLGIAGSSGGEVIIATAGRQPLKALAAVGSSLLIFHEKAISRFTGLTIDDIEVLSGTQGVSSTTGTFAPQSLVVVDNVAYFATDRGFYAATENSAEPIGQGQVDTICTGLHAPDLALITAAHDRANRQILWCVPEVGIYVYNYRIGSFSGPWTGSYLSPETTSLWSAGDADGVSIVLAGGYDGFVRLVNAPGSYLDDVLSDGSGGTAYEFVVTLRRMFFGGMANTKSLRAIHVLCDLRGSQVATVYYTIGQAAGSKILVAGGSSIRWGDGTTWSTTLSWPLRSVASRRALGGGIGQYVDITISDESESDALFSRVEVEAFNLGRR